MKTAMVSGWLGMLALVSWVAPTAAADSQTVMVVVGAEGTPEYGRQFLEWHDRWRTATERAGAKWISIGTTAMESGAKSDREVFREALAAELAVGENPGQEQPTGEPLWLVLIGHGTFDGKQAKFNLRGTDVSARELAEWLQPCRRPLVLVNSASASGPFLSALGALPPVPGPIGTDVSQGAVGTRVVVTATKSGQEQNYARFGDYLSAAIGGTEADGDKDGETSLLEAYLWAARRVAEFYEQESRLATEHSLLDDNRDGLGTPADWFTGLRATKKAQNAAEVDGRRARQLALVRNPNELQLSPEVRAKRDALEMELERLRDQKGKLAEPFYLEQLEVIMRQLAALYAPKS